MKINVKVEGIEDLRATLKAEGVEAEKLVKTAVLQSALLIQGDARKLIQKGVKSGRVYPSKRSKNVMHQASAPGEPPATDTGRLVANVLFAIEQGGYSARVGTDLEYGKNLEFGTRKMAARPWLSRAITENSDKIINLISNAIRKAIK